MSLPAFDAHAYVKRLVSAGFNEKQAEAQAELQAQVLSTLVTEKLATKNDILRLENATKEDISRLENTTKNSTLRLEHETKQEFIRMAGKIDRILWLGGLILAGTLAIFDIPYRNFLIQQY